MNRHTKTAAIVAGALMASGAQAGGFNALGFDTSRQIDTYFGAAIQSIDISGFGSGIALVATASQDMPEVAPNFALEAETSLTVVKPSFSVSYFGSSATIDVTVFTVAGYGIMKYPLSETLTLYGRGGLLFESMSATVSCSGCPGYTASISDDTEAGLSFGAGAKIDLGKGLIGRADWTVIETDVTHLSASIQYNFF